LGWLAMRWTRSSCMLSPSMRRLLEPATASWGAPLTPLWRESNSGWRGA